MTVVFNEKDFKDELSREEHWQEAYIRLISKQGFKKDDKELLWRIKEVYKLDIIDSIMSGNYKWSIPKKVEIAKSNTNKKRVVYIYNIKDRYIISVLYRALCVYYNSIISNRCFSYRKGTNTSNAIKYIIDNRTDKHKYGVKVDIHAYFNSINKEKVTAIINELFSGGLKSTIEGLMLDETVMYKGNEIQEWKSLIPGCALSSFFANIALNSLDNYFDEHNIIYARYSDDIIVIDESNEKLQESLNVILNYLDEYGLTINKDKYTWFKPGDNIEYLGLKFDDKGNIDISDHAKQKIKKQIHRWCRKGRMQIENKHTPFDVVAKRIVRRINSKNLFCMISRDNSFGWAIYAFPKINVTESLKEIDLYTKDTLRAMKTGKHNKANYKAITEDEFKELGWVSLVQLYYLYKKDYDYFCEIIELLM